MNLRGVRRWRNRARRRYHNALEKLGEMRERNAPRRKRIRQRAKVKRRRAIWQRLAERIRRRRVPGIVDGGWHPQAERNQMQGGIGAYLDVPPKLVWHTTEGFGLPTYSGSHPHFTLDPKTGKLWQHISIRSGAMALRNLPGGVETNRAHAIQVELIGFARETPGWSDVAYANIAKLARWIEKHAGVPRRSSVHFQAGVDHLSSSGWLRYAGHLGHQHVPENDHWDPGAFEIRKVV